MGYRFILLCLWLCVVTGPTSAAAAGALLDDFETLQGWSTATSEGVRLEIAHDRGPTGMNLRLDFDFQGNNGYAVVRKALALPLPENYAFSFRLRGEAPVNSLEFKLVDGSGHNVWWYRLTDVGFPADWQRVVIRKRQLSFAWGPAAGGALNNISALELAITPGQDGKGSLWIDDLRLEAREPTADYTLTPAVSASTAVPGREPERLREPAAGGWKSGALAEDQWLLFDFLKMREYGGLIIDWDPDDYATAYRVLTGDDGEQWDLAYEVTAGNGGRDYLYLPDRESRYLKLELRQSSRRQGYGVVNVAVQPYPFSTSINRFFAAVAADAPRGRYPRYLQGEQSYWTLVGMEHDEHEGLLNEDGMLEVDQGAFSIEPFLYSNGNLITWSDVVAVQELAQGYLPVPTVIWRPEPLVFSITAFAAGEPGSSTLYARYRLENIGSDHRQVSVFLAVRPLQVNPPWQALNRVGGAAPVRELAYENRTLWVNHNQAVVALAPPDRFGAAAFDSGPITDYLAVNQIPAATRVSDPFGYASGAFHYSVELAAGAVWETTLAIPFGAARPDTMARLANADNAYGRAQLDAVLQHWRQRLDRVVIQLPPAAARLTRTLKSTLAYILINRDGPALQPGSRCYARSWIRDGSLTSSALLEMGYTEEVRAFLRWYAGFQYADGKIPCCVDHRGADPTVEHDSSGEFIYAVAEYYRYTRDVGFIGELWPHVVRAVEYLDSLRRQRLTPDYLQPERLPFYGLLPESISHEGYTARPVHSYWDDFFALRGFKDAAMLAVVLGDDERMAAFATLRDAFRHDLYASIGRTMAWHGLDTLPASVELGDFDPTATAIAVTPGGEREWLPAAALQKTFADYEEFFLLRGNAEVNPVAYAPYEMRVVATLVQLGRRRFALNALDYFLDDRRPAAWNQWAEVVWRDPRTPQFIGDMPHTWVGSDYIRSLRSLFAFEREADRALVVAAGIAAEWVQSADGVTVKRLPTHYGVLNYKLRATGPGEIQMQLSGDLDLPPGGIVLEPPLERPLRAVQVNGRPVADFEEWRVRIGEFPAEVVLSIQ